MPHLEAQNKLVVKNPYETQAFQPLSNRWKASNPRRFGSSHIPKLGSDKPESKVHLFRLLARFSWPQPLRTFAEGALGRATSKYCAANCTLYRNREVQPHASFLVDLKRPPLLDLHGGWGVQSCRVSWQETPLGSKNLFRNGPASPVCKFNLCMTPQPPR